MTNPNPKPVVRWVCVNPAGDIIPNLFNTRRELQEYYCDSFNDWSAYKFDGYRAVKVEVRPV